MVAVLSRYITGRGRPGTGTLILVAGLAINIGANLVLIPALRDPRRGGGLVDLVRRDRGADPRRLPPPVRTAAGARRWSSGGPTSWRWWPRLRALVERRAGPADTVRSSACVAAIAAADLVIGEREPGEEPLSVGIRLVVVDDNPHVAWDGRVHPANATFQRFVAALLDLPGSPVASITSCVPLARRGCARRRPCRSTRGSGSSARRRSTGSPGTCVTCRRCSAPTAPTLPPRDRRAPTCVWLKVPASNAALAGGDRRREPASPRFVWVAGSAADVAAGRFDGTARRRWPGRRRRLRR